jgi:hypothetical protein
MQATRGFAVSIRSRGRLIGSFAALAVLMAAFLAPSSASATTLPIKQQYLALGDSLAFGYSKQLYNEGNAAGYEDPEGFMKGYADELQKLISAKAKKEGSGLRLINDGCPGETSAGLIGTNATLLGTLNAALKKTQEEKGLPPVSGESPCPYQAAWNAFKTAGIGGPLHHPFSGSQLEDAIEVIQYAVNVEKKPVTSISLNIGANDELKTIGKIEKEAKEFVEAKVVKKSKEFVEAKVFAASVKFVEAKLAKIGQEAVEAKLKVVGEEAVKAKLKVVAEEAVKAKLEKVAQEAIEAKVAEQVYIKCSEKAFAESGGEEPAFAEDREKCLATEGKKLGEEYYAEHKAQLEKEGKEAAEKYYGEHKAQLEKEGEEAAGKYYGEHKAQLEKEGKEAAEKYYGEHKAQLEKEGKEAAEKYYGEHKAEIEKEAKEFGEKYFVEHKAELEKEGKEFGEKYAAENFFQLRKEGGEFASPLILAALPGLVKQIVSNQAGILLALRQGATLGLDKGKAVNYTGRIYFQGSYNPFGKLFHFAKEGVEFVNAHGGPFGPYGSINGRCQVQGETQKEEEEKIAGGCTASEIQSGFSNLVGKINETIYEGVHGGFGACMTFPNKEFNNGSQTGEPEKLGLWINMTNGTSTEIKGKPAPNGPDIHPTPAGYVQLGKEMNTQGNGKCHKELLPGF